MCKIINREKISQLWFLDKVGNRVEEREDQNYYTSSPSKLDLKRTRKMT